MLPQHTDPTRARRKRDKNVEYRAHAPYNFVPLPEQVVAAEEPLPFDRYEGLSGWIECEIETCSPTYTRGLLTREQFDRLEGKKSEDLTDADKRERAGFYAPTPDDVIEGLPKPRLPGSSLRGMVRDLVEIIAYGKMRWVNDAPHVSLRAVAAQADDPLSKPYDAVIGRNGANVKAGYLMQDGEKWYVQPALSPQNLGFSKREGPYLKIKQSAHLAELETIPGFKEFDDKEYAPAVLPVTFEASTISGKKGPHTIVARIGSREAKLARKGALVCSGNMLETGAGQTESPRRRFALVLAADSKQLPLMIPPAALANYRETLTDFQKSEPFDTVNGCLKHGAPVFYVANGKEVAAFGHTPNFRIPARRPEAELASTPLDFVPDELRKDVKLDLADVLFGWTPEYGGQRDTSMAGRVFFEDAAFVKSQQGVWYAPEPITPKILASPKPTTFQHYLIQDKQRGHDPDLKAQLAHYGTPTNETVIRGYKMYWHQGRNPAIKLVADAEEREKKRKQTTQIRPVKPGVTFHSKIHFENLRPHELGGLLWALTLPGQEGRQYRHKFGMGKPLGMGALRIQPALHLVQRIPEGDARDTRYQQLLDGERWHAAEHETEATRFIEAFTQYLLVTKGVAPDRTQLAEVPRIQDLLALLEWRGDTPDADWLNLTRYMEIENEQLGNEYAERPVLPTPRGVASQRRGRQS